MPNGRECVDAVRWALELGYRHIDTAQAYGNEESVGQGLREGGVRRDQAFITTKFHPDGGTRSQRLSVASSGSGSSASTCTWFIGRGWPDLGVAGNERAHELGYARSIGVSNFNVAELQQLLATASIAPVVNQVQFSPYEYRKGLLDACRENRIRLEAYSPLGRGRHLGSETVTRIARRLGRTPSQVLFRWCVERDVPLIAKSTHRERIAENAQIFDFTLSSEDMAELDALDRTGRTERALEQKWW